MQVFEYTCYGILAVLLIFVIMEDYRYRAVHWWLFPLLLLVAVGIEFNSIQPEDIFLNACFILLNLAMLSLYAAVKEKRIVNITKSYLGLGDILFWMFVCLLFSPLNFIFFFIVSLIFTMILSLIVKLIKVKETNSIPLAGIQSIVLLLILITKIFIQGFSLRSDDWITTILIG